jgi:RNA polymerase-binding transcription factor
MKKPADSDREWAERLEANRQQLARLATAFEEEAGLHKPLAESVGDIITRDYDDADFAQALADRENNETLIHLLGQNREQVERALERLADGSYGYCEDCGEKIAAERLKFRPESTRCVDCQSRWDRLNRRTA